MDRVHLLRMERPPVPPPRPDVQGVPDAPIEPRPRRWLVLVAALVAVVGVVAVVATLAGRGDGFPDAVLGFERLRGGSAERAEEAMEGIRIGRIEVRAAVYGIGVSPRMVAAIYENYPEGVDVEAIIQGAAGGA
jgi:GNAT superfamily N-acetyltransferase